MTTVAAPLIKLAAVPHQARGQVTKDEHERLREDEVGAQTQCGEYIPECIFLKNKDAILQNSQQTAQRNRDSPPVSTTLDGMLTKSQNLRQHDTYTNEAATLLDRRADHLRFF
jgi:hypothetical protein